MPLRIRSRKSLQRCFHRGFCFAVPVHSQDKIPETYRFLSLTLSVTVIQIWRIIPVPSICASITVSWACTQGIQGEPFLDGPSTLAAIPPFLFLPFDSPVNAARISLLQPGCLIHIPIHFIPPICIPDRSSTELSPVSCYSPAISTSHTRMLPSETNHPSLFPDSLYMRNPKATSLFTYNTARES